MPLRQNVLWFFTSLAIVVPVGLATAADVTRSNSKETAEQYHKRIIQEHVRLSRAMPPSPPQKNSPDNGIVQRLIPIDKNNNLTKEIDEAKSRLPQLTPITLPVGPALPFDPGSGCRVAPEGNSSAPPSLLIPTKTNKPQAPLSPGALTNQRILSNPPPGCPNLPSSAELVKAFQEVTWDVCVRDVWLKGLWVGPVHLQRTPNGPWIKVLDQAGLAEIFVPYHSTNFRPYDMQWSAYCSAELPGLDQVFSLDAGSGSLITLSPYLPPTSGCTTVPPLVPTVVAEVRDRGIAWLCKGNSNTRRRAEEFLIWGVTDGGNYDNITQYGFRDDGTITFRLGNTGYNSPVQHNGYPPPDEPHMHNGLWRVDIDLDGGNNDSAYELTHTEPFPNASPLTATDSKVPFNNNVEGGLKLDALKFTSVLIEDNIVKNSYGHNIGYEFVSSLHPGTARHYGSDDDWTKNDFYVSLNNSKSTELNWTTNFLPPDEYLLEPTGTAIINNQSLTTLPKDLVVWVKASGHHDPTDEDKSLADLNFCTNSTSGVTLVHWSGFDMAPHNLFDANPLGGPRRCETW